MARTVTKKTARPEEMNDWDLILAACHHSRNIVSLNEKARAELYRRVWAESDGYGEKGYVPCQGCDWSGIRDSSPAAKKNMASVARLYLRGFLTIVVEETAL